MVKVSSLDAPPLAGDTSPPGRGDEMASKRLRNGPPATSPWLQPTVTGYQFCYSTPRSLNRAGTEIRINSLHRLIHATLTRRCTGSKAADAMLAAAGTTATEACLLGRAWQGRAAGTRKVHGARRSHMCQVWDFRHRYPTGPPASACVAGDAGPSGWHLPPTKNASLIALELIALVIVKNASNRDVLCFTSLKVHHWHDVRRL
jgi:hypothetical protein